MTLKDIIARIEGVAAAQPSVNMIVRQDVFRINDAVQKRYGLFAWVQRRHTTSVRSSLMDYSFVFYYVDRLTESRDNMTDIHSAGIRTLDNIIRQVADGEVVSVDDPYSFNGQWIVVLEMTSLPDIFIGFWVGLPVLGLPRRH